MHGTKRISPRVIQDAGALKPLKSPMNVIRKHCRIIPHAGSGVHRVPTLREESEDHPLDMDPDHQPVHAFTTAPSLKSSRICDIEIA
jgi:hypothetical protein